MSPSRFGRPAILVAAAAVLLSGCGAGNSPGVAAKVGDEEISMSRVDSASQALCQSQESSLRDNGQVVAMRQVRRLVVTLLADASTARQVAAEYDVSPGPEVGRESTQWASVASTLPEDSREDFIEVMTAQVLKQSVASQAGAASLLAEGVTDPTPEEAAARGADIFGTWPDSEGLELDPRFGLTVADGQYQLADTDLSVAVSDLATAASNDADTEHPKTLPENQRCG